MESLRWPNEERNCSRVMAMPSLAIVSRQEIQWYSSESIRVPSMSQRTARLVFISTCLGNSIAHRAVRLEQPEPHASLGATRSPDFFSNLGERVLFQVARIAIEFADAFGELFRRHGVFVVHPAEGFLAQAQAFVFAC